MQNDMQTVQEAIERRWVGRIVQAPAPEQTEGRQRTSATWPPVPSLRIWPAISGCRSTPPTPAL